MSTPKEYTENQIKDAEQRLYSDAHMTELMNQLGKLFSSNEPKKVQVHYDGTVIPHFHDVVISMINSLRAQLRKEVNENYPELSFVYELQAMHAAGMVIPEGAPHYWRDPEVDKPGLGEYLIIDNDGNYGVKAVLYPGDAWQYSSNGEMVRKVLRYQPVPVMDPSLAHMFFRNAQ